MEIKQWEDKNLSHFSYGILSDNKIIFIDPSRNPDQYLAFAKEHDAEIIGIIETHPHADFISSHLELHETTGATIYTSSMVEAAYSHKALDDGDTVEYGKVKLSALYTPGHSPDSITILLTHDGRQKAVFTGDTLFIGDCGRPDLRPGDGDAKGEAQKLARQMYHSLRDKILPLDDNTIVYPAHGAGSLCGKALSKAKRSTLGEEKHTNWSLKQQTEEEFVKELLKDQPFVPAYFPYNVDLNKKGATPFNQSISAVNIGDPINNETDADRLNKETWIVDARPEKDYKKGHLPLSVNLMEDTKFETWLGSIIKPGEEFYLTGESTEQIQRLIARAAAIGYETRIKEAFLLAYAAEEEEPIDVATFRQHQDDYTIVDVRNTSEVKEGKPFKNSLSIPLAELRSKVDQIPTDKPIVVHCAGGYRSAAASSIIQSTIRQPVDVFDLGEAIKQFQ